MEKNKVLVFHQSSFFLLVSLICLLHMHSVYCSVGTDKGHPQLLMEEDTLRSSLPCHSQKAHLFHRHPHYAEQKQLDIFLHQLCRILKSLMLFWLLSYFFPTAGTRLMMNGELAWSLSSCLLNQPHCGKGSLASRVK